MAEGGFTKSAKGPLRFFFGFSSELPASSFQL